MTLKKIVRPVIGSFEEDADPVGFARTVAEEYAIMENGYHAQLRGFLRRAYQAYDLFREFPETFEQLKQDLFWGNSRQKPKDLTTSKWVLLFIMRAKTPNVRVRASKYAKILDRFTHDGVKVGEVEGRISALGGVEAAYEHVVAAERGRAPSSAEEDDVERENEGRRIPRKGKPPQRSIHTTLGGRRPMPSFDPERSLIVELEPAVLDDILAAGTTQGGPVRFRLEITVYPRDAKGFVCVVGEPEPADLPPDFSSIDPADGPFHTNLFTEKPVRPPVRPKRPPGKRKRKLRPWTGRPVSIFAK